MFRDNRNVFYKSSLYLMFTINSYKLTLVNALANINQQCVIHLLMLVNKKIYLFIVSSDPLNNINNYNLWF